MENVEILFFLSKYLLIQYSEGGYTFIVTFYNAVICSIIMFGSVGRGGNISKLDRGRLEKIVKKAGHVVGKATGQF